MLAFEWYLSREFTDHQFVAGLNEQAGQTDKS